MSFLNRLIRNFGAGFGAGTELPAYAGLMTAGCDHQAAGRLDEAVDCFTKALIAMPESQDAYVCRGVALKANGETKKAIDDAVSALSLADSPVAKSLFAACIEDLPFLQERPGLSQVLARALTEAWCHPQLLIEVATGLVKQDPTIASNLREPAGKPFDVAGCDAIAENELLIALLTTAPICDVGLEHCLIAVRRAALGRVAKVGSDELALRFGAALARQCFINEYVFEVTDDESRKAAALMEALQRAIQTRTTIDPFDLIVLASYDALGTLQGSEQLLTGSWPDAVDRLLTQQIREPMKEASLASGIPRITAIENQVSQEVRKQYEENPYPRWVTTVPPNPVAGLDAFLDLNFPNVKFEPVDGTGCIDILVAGCGTGQHSIHAGNMFPDASVLAVDLSLASLAYANRKTEELAMRNIEYAQADILELAGLDRQFDLIETAGVLHHLDDPLAGWRVLHALLRPNGIMKVGLYSERAREGIKAARKFIADKGYGSSAAEIRRCRAEMMAPAGSVNWSLESADFFTISGCRDLLFHVQEWRFTLTQIKAFLDDNGLRFLGFVLPSAVKAQYRARFPDDPAMTDLDHWHAFETENPYTFTDMYQFFVQKT